uniref:Uncharacterized protein n=1 Tax=Anguilla anguilla TaxID=7936 RepID=A0A0E9SPB3_ANGAN
MGCETLCTKQSFLTSKFKALNDITEMTSQRVARRPGRPAHTGGPSSRKGHSDTAADRATERRSRNQRYYVDSC